MNNQEATTGCIVYHDGLHVVVRRIFPDVYELASVHWNVRLSRYIGERTSRFLVIHRGTWDIIDRIDKDNWKRILGPSDNYMYRGLQFSGYAIDRAYRYVESYNKRHKKKLDTTLLAVRPWKEIKNGWGYNIRVTNGLSDPIYEDRDLYA